MYRQFTTKNITSAQLPIKLKHLGAAISWYATRLPYARENLFPNRELRAPRGLKLTNQTTVAPRGKLIP